jgi:molecular chaperone DnaK (HSP70)
MSQEEQSLPTTTEETQQQPTTPETAAPVEPPFPSLVGIDLGNEEIVLACCQYSDNYPTIVRNDTSDTGTKNLVSFKNLERLFGEGAVGHVSVLNLVSRASCFGF